MTRMAEVVVADRALVCIPVSTSNSVLAVPPAKPGTTIWPEMAWGSACRAWRFASGSSSGEKAKAGLSVMSEKASFITITTFTGWPGTLAVSWLSHRSASALRKPSGLSTG